MENHRFAIESAALRLTERGNPPIKSSQRVHIEGHVSAGFDAVRDAFAENFSRRHELGGACCVYHRGKKVVDLWGGVRNKSTGAPWQEDTMVVVYSTTKGLAAMTLAVAHSRRWLDYEERVCTYWPEFAQQGKETITVRQLLARQAGLFAFDEPVDRSVVADLDRLAVVLARQKPAWEPGARQAYHAITLGFFESELLRRVDPHHRSLGQFFQDEIASPLGLDFYIRLPESIPNSRLATIARTSPIAMLLGLPIRFTLAAFNRRSNINRALIGSELPHDEQRIYARNLESPSGGGVGENHPHWVIAYLGVLYHGAVAVPLDQATNTEALAHFIDDSEAKLAFVSPSSLDKFRAVCERLGRRIPAVILRDGAQANGFARFEDWARTPRPPEFDAAPPHARPEDAAVLMYTSGTTGTPKAVPLTHGNIFAESDGVQKALRVTDREVVLSLLPLFHAYSQVVNLWVSTIIGARLIYITELSSAEIERGLKEGGATALVGVPRLWYLFHKKIFDAVARRPLPVQWLFRAMLGFNGRLRDWLGVNAGRFFFKRVHDSFGGRLRLAVSAGASFDARVARDFHSLGFTILQGYGLSETAGAATVTRFEDNKVGSVGAPLDGVEVRIDQPDKEEIGEVLIRGPIVMPGYYRNPEVNREAFTADGWFRSGDLGRFDRAGHLYIVGRKKDVIKLPTGKQIFPDDVEAHYGRSPLASEICVLGVRDPSSRFERAEKLLAVVVPDFDYLKTHHIANAREAIRFDLDNLGHELPEYQRVRDYLVRAEPLPRTTTRKVKRFELKNQIEGAGEIAGAARRSDRFVLSSADRDFMNSPAGRAVAAAIKQQSPEAAIIHPQMNLELDLGLDSLARAECVVSVERSLDVEFAPEAEAAALTVGELIALARSVSPEGRLAEQKTSHLDWREILAGGPSDTSDLRPILRRKPLAVFVAYALLRLVYFVARTLLRLEVEGRDVPVCLRRPFLICPNHQSYLDAIILCSTYPRDMLPHIFHVGASEYFASPFMMWLARTLNIAPVDPDTHLLRAMRASAGGLRAGKILNLYPEGQRSFDGRLQEFKNGAAILATELDLPIVPVAIDGTYRVWPRDSWRIRPAKVRVSFGEPFTPRSAITGGVSGEAAYEAVANELKRRIQRMLDEMRRG